MGQASSSLDIPLPSCYQFTTLFITVAAWSLRGTLCICCVYSQPEGSREHGGARWGHRCHTDPGKILLPAHTGRPPALPAESFILFLHIGKPSDDPLDGTFYNNRICFWAACLCSRWKWWTRWRTRSATTTMKKKPYLAWSEQDKARKRSAGKTLSLLIGLNSLSLKKPNKKQPWCWKSTGPKGKAMKSSTGSLCSVSFYVHNTSFQHVERPSASVL